MFAAIPGLVATVVGGVRSRLRRALRGGGPDRGALVGSLAEPVVCVDDGGRVVDANRAAERLLGDADGSVRGRPLATVVPALADHLHRDARGAGDAGDDGGEGADRGDHGGGDAGDDRGARDGVVIPLPVDGERRSYEVVGYPAEGGEWLVFREVTEAEHYRRLVENVADPVFVTDGDGEVVAVSDALVERLGYDRDRLVGSDVGEFVATPDHERGEALVAELLSEDRDWGTFEGRAIHADGERRLYEDSVRVLTDDDGALTAVVHSIRDVEDRRRRERELEQYETIVETVPVGVFVLDANGVIVEANRRGAAMLGLDRAALRGTAIDDLQRRGVVGPELPDRETVVASLSGGDGDAAEAGTGTYELTVRPTDADEERVVEARVALRPGEEFSGFIGVLRDVTGRQRRVDELEQYEAIMEVLPDPVYATDAEGRVTFANRAFEEQLGYPREDTGMHFSEFTTQEDTEAVLDLLREMVGDAGPERATVEIVVVTSDGRQRRVEDSIALLPGGGEFRGTAGVLRDVTERKRRQEVLTVMNRALRHNLRTNVTTIVGYADLLDREVDGEAETFVQRIRDSADWLAKLGDTLRTLQRAIEADLTEDVGVDVEDVVAGVVADAREDHPDADVALHVATAGELEAGWPLQYALENVLENAVVHSDRGEPDVDVWVADAPREGWVDIHVEDDGPGIPDDEREVVMGDAAITQLQHGSGIGLWLTRWLVEVFGGELVIEENDPRGTVVTMRLPRSAAEGG